jgi:hypothetical protein
MMPNHDRCGGGGGGTGGGGRDESTWDSMRVTTLPYFFRDVCDRTESVTSASSMWQ